MIWPSPSGKPLINSPVLRSLGERLGKGLGEAEEAEMAEGAPGNEEAEGSEKPEGARLCQMMRTSGISFHDFV